jgi:hypothetical protein
MNCPTCHRPTLKHQPSKRFEDVFATIAILWAVLGIMAAGGIVQAIMDTHWIEFLVTLALYGLGTAVLILWWKIKAL